MIDNYKRSISKIQKKNYMLMGVLLIVVIIIGVKIDFHFLKIYKGIPSMYNLIERMFNPNWSYAGEVFSKLLETVSIAVVSSVIGVSLSIPFALLTARNIAPSPIISILLNSFFSLLRTIPNLIWAALLVSVFSIGKMPGTVALTITALLVSLKLFKENIETISDNLINSVKSVGANQLQVLRYCVLPAISELLTSIFFMVFEINIRSATVLGLVGAGGIGQIMWRDLNHLRYDNLATLVFILFLTILLIDTLSFIARKGLKDKFIIHKSVDSYQRFRQFKNYVMIAVVLSVIFLNLSAIAVSGDRMKVGLEQGLFIVKGMTKLEFSYLPKLIEGLTTSLFIAIFATITGAIGALILSYFTAYNTSPHRGISVSLKVVINILRTFPPIVTAIIFFRGVGPGPLAGAMALSLYTTGVLTKLYSEVIESSHENIKNSLVVTGCTNLNCFRHGIVPQTFPMYMSLVLYRLESNIRNSTILGIIGAGGVGTILAMNISWRNWGRVGLLILGIAVMIISIDTLSQYLRKKFS